MIHPTRQHTASSTVPLFNGAYAQFAALLYFIEKETGRLSEHSERMKADWEQAKPVPGSSESVYGQLGQTLQSVRKMKTALNWNWIKKEQLNRL